MNHHSTIIRLFVSLQLCSLIAAFGQPIDARNELMFPINPPRNVSPDKRTNVIPKAFSVATPPSPGTPATLPLQPEFKITKAEVNETTSDTKELRATISHMSSKKLSPSDIQVMCFFYESNQNGDIFIATSKVEPTWVSPPVDWSESATEDLILRNSAPPQTSDLKYSGCAIGIYLGHQLQDTWATNPGLLSKFPFPENQQTYDGISPITPKQSHSESDKFLAAYKNFQKAQGFVQAGDLNKAKEVIKEVISVLVALQEESPDWQPQVVEYRVASAKKLLAKIEEK